MPSNNLIKRVAGRKRDGRPNGNWSLCGAEGSNGDNHLCLKLWNLDKVNNLRI